MKTFDLNLNDLLAIKASLEADVSGLMVQIANVNDSSHKEILRARKSIAKMQIHDLVVRIGIQLAIDAEEIGCKKTDWLNSSTDKIEAKSVYSNNEQRNAQLEIQMIEQVRVIVYRKILNAHVRKEFVKTKAARNGEINTIRHQETINKIDNYIVSQGEKIIHFRLKLNKLYCLLSRNNYPSRTGLPGSQAESFKSQKTQRIGSGYLRRYRHQRYNYV